jgi:anti-sigma B factor antagonist
MRDHERLNLVIVSLPAEIDMANEEDVGEQLRAAFAPGVTVVIADLGSTVFCGTSGVRQLVLARKRAVASNRELRVVISSAGVLRILAILGLDRELEIYPDLAAALAIGLAPDGQGYAPGRHSLRPRRSSVRDSSHCGLFLGPGR